jgi:hypothetical protein
VHGGWRGEIVAWGKLVGEHVRLGAGGTRAILPSLLTIIRQWSCKENSLRKSSKVSPVSFKFAIHGLAGLQRAGFSAQMFMRRTELPITTKLSAEYKTPPIANVLLAVVISSTVLKVIVLKWQ